MHIRFGVFFAALCLTGCATDPKATLATLDTNDAKHDTGACAQARADAVRFNDRVSERVGAGVALGLTLGPLGLPIAAAIDARQASAAQTVTDRLLDNCLSSVDPSALATSTGPNTPPRWKEAPSPSLIARNYPLIARAAKVAGAVNLECRLDAPTGELRNCAVVDEMPAGYGFGTAALKLAPSFRFVPRLTDGRPVDGETLSIPFHFKAPKKSEKKAGAQDALPEQSHKGS